MTLITDDMIKAGVAAYLEHDMQLEPLTDVLRHVYQAMADEGADLPNRDRIDKEVTMRDFLAQPITAAEMEDAIGVAWATHLHANGGKADLRCLILQEAARAIKRLPELMSVLDEIQGRANMAEVVLREIQSVAKSAKTNGKRPGAEA